jgi:MYXO-CTERM domain-containing protein
MLPMAPSLFRAFVLLGATFVALPASAAGTWTQAPPNTAAGGQAFGLWLLTDGTVLSHGSALNHWVILSPDKTGSYAKGTWKSVASSAHARGGAQQHILKDGRFFQAGGEYVDGPACTPTLCKSAEIYDPVADTWTDVAPGLYDIGDTGSATLADGRILDSTRNGNQIQIYDPVANQWTNGATIPLMSGDENAWASLQNGGVLAVGYQTDGAAIYNPATDKWIRTGPVPSGFNTGDTGGISQMFDGRVFVYGLGQSYIYTPGATAADPGTWALGPKMLNGDEAEDEFSDTLPNGKVWGGLVTMTYGPGVVLQQFDPTTNTVSSVTPPPDTGNPYPIGYVNLPNGQVMVTCANNDWIYTPDTGPEDAWRPTVTSVAYASGSTYTLTGTQLSGLVNGADEGDDMTMAENYPIVWLTDKANNVYYCRSYGFSNMMPSVGNTPQTCQFTTPAGLPAGTYSLYVSAVGVESKTAFAFTTGVGGGGDAGAATSGDAGAGGAGEAGSGSDASASGGGDGGGGSAEDGGLIADSGTASGGGGADGGSGAGERPGAPSGCGCRTAGKSSGRDGWAALMAFLGLALAMSRSRSRPRGPGAQDPSV